MLIRKLPRFQQRVDASSTGEVLAGNDLKS